MAEATGGTISTQPAAAPEAAAPVEAQAAPDAQQTQQEIDEEYDLGEEIGKVKRSSIRDVLKNRRELDKGAHAKFQEAAKLRKDVEKIAQMLVEDPEAAYKALGHDFKQIAAKRLQREFERAEMTPEQRQIEDERQELARLRHERQQWEAKQREDAEKTQTTQHIQHWDAQLTAAIRQAGLPPSYKAEMAQKLVAYAEEHGVDPSMLPLGAIAQEVRQEWLDKQDATLGDDAVTAEQVLSMLSPKVVEKVRKALLAKLQTPNQSKPKQPVPQKESKSKPDEKLDIASWRKLVKEA